MGLDLGGIEIVPVKAGGVFDVGRRTAAKKGVHDEQYEIAVSPHRPG